MKKLLSIMVSATLSLSAFGQSAPQLRSDNIDEVLKAMTLHEKALLVVGTGMPNLNQNIGGTEKLVPGAAGTTCAIPRLGIPAIVLSDGPAGLRISPTRPYDSHTYYCTHFPIGTCLASSWNTQLVTNVGAAIGNEVLEYGADVLLAPGVDLHRNPLCGRNFEYYSEDPVLAGYIAAAYINGVQSQGVGTSIKHYAMNDQETARLGNDARLSERTARELYLKQFEIAVKNAQPWTVMSSYNKVNGTMTSERYDMLTTVLRDEWGFKGLVMTDWFGGTDPVWRNNKTDRAANMRAGNDLIEPGTPDDVKAIEDAVNNGKLDINDLNRNVHRVLELIVKTPRFKGYKYSNEPDLKAHAMVTRRSAAEGTVLLENRGALPLGNQVKHVALFGVASYDPIAGGTGSGNVNRAYTVSLVEGMRNNGYVVDDSLINHYTSYIKQAKEEISKVPHEWWQNLPLPTEMLPDRTLLNEAVSVNDVAIITLERLSGEGSDRTAKDFNLTDEELQLIKQVTNAFHAAGKKTVVVLNVGGVIESASWKSIPDAVLLPWQCGQEIGNSVADILAGKLSPSGKLPMTWPVNLSDVPSTKNFPTDGVEISFSQKDLSKYRTVKDVGYTNYEEGLNVGYRYFDTSGTPVSYPFGYGLSYTTFTCSPLQLSRNGSTVKVTFTVTNTGDCAGKQVVQLYVSAPKGKVVKPVHELKAFAKTKELKPGESQSIMMTVDEMDLASYVEKSSSWVADAGEYEFQLGFSSQDIQQRASLKLPVMKVKAHKILASAK
ncbi:MAG: glycoside hydrolase family 3 C-terminal domain-containing protein [Prevotella sp.]|jgi:beta-glucosidase